VYPQNNGQQQQNNFYQGQQTYTPHEISHTESPAASILKGLFYVGIFFAAQFIISGAFVILVAVSMIAATPGNPAVGENFAENLQNTVYSYSNHVSALSGIVTLLFLVIFFLIRRKNPIKEFGFRRIRFSVVILSALTGFTMNFACNILMLLMPQSWIENYMEASAGLSEGSFLSFIIGGVIVAPLVEEIIFRSLLLTRLKRVLRPVLSALIVAAVFGIAHGDIVWAIYAGSLGLVFCLIFNKFDSVWPSLIMHFTFNGTSAVLQLVNDALNVNNMSDEGIVLYNLVFIAISLLMTAATAVLITAMLTSKKLNAKKEPMSVCSTSAL
jgi:membrane protease YdiL (CAAX protease family)